MQFGTPISTLFIFNYFFNIFCTFSPCISAMHYVASRHWQYNRITARANTQLTDFFWKLNLHSAKLWREIIYNASIKVSVSAISYLPYVSYIGTYLTALRHTFGICESRIYLYTRYCMMPCLVFRHISCIDLSSHCYGIHQVTSLLVPHYYHNCNRTLHIRYRKCTYRLFTKFTPTSYQLLCSCQPQLTGSLKPFKLRGDYISCRIWWHSLSLSLWSSLLLTSPDPFKV